MKNNDAKFNESDWKRQRCRTNDKHFLSRIRKHNEKTRFSLKVKSLV